MKNEMNHLIGIKPYKQQTCDLLSNFNIMQFSGNQHNEDWVWNCEMLNDFSGSELEILYNSIYNENHNEIPFNYSLHLPQRYIDLYEAKIKIIQEKEKRIDNLRKMFGL